MGTFFNGDYSFQSNLTSFDMGNTTFANNSAYSMFSGCGNFNQPITIPNYLTNVSQMFYGCYNFNSVIDIHPESNITDMYSFITSDRFSQNINIPYNTLNWRYPVLCSNFNANVYLYANKAGWTSSNDGDYINAFMGCNFNGNVIFQHTPVNMSNMFRDCSYLNQNIQIPSGPSQNCWAMFQGCSNLDRTIEIPDNVDAAYCFSSCSRLSKAIRIPSNSNISNMFDYCSSFNQPVHVPAFPTSSDSDSSNGSGIFYSCRSLNASVTFDDSITVLSNTFYNCRNLDVPFELPSSLKYAHSTFGSCSNFNSPVELPDGLISMSGMFSGTSFNINVNIPESVTNMGGTFSYSKMNQNLNLPPNVNDLSLTFANCVNFNQKISIPSFVQDAHEMFRGCTNFNQEIVVPPLIRDVSGMFVNCHNFYLDSINVPQNAYRISNFVARTKIKNVTIDSSSIYWQFNNFVTLAYNTIDVNGKTPATTCTTPVGITSHPSSFGDDIAHISINNNCIVNKSGTTMSFNSLWNDTQATWGIVWETMFGGVGVGVTQFFSSRDYYNDHPIGHLQVYGGTLNGNYRQEIYYHDLMNAWVNQQSSIGYEWNVYHVDLSFY